METARYLCICAGGLEEEAAEVRCSLWWMTLRTPCHSPYLASLKCSRSTHPRTQATRAFLRRAVPDQADRCTIEIFGMEDDAASAPAAKRRRVVMQGTAALGKVLVTTPRSLPVMAMLQSPFFICTLALVGEAHAVPNDKAGGLPYIEAAVRDAEGWAGALTTWAAAQDALAPPVQPQAAEAPAAAATEAPAASTWSDRTSAYLASPSPDVVDAESSSPTTASPGLGLRFRASCMRDGDHQFRKPDIMPVVGAAVAARLGEAAVVNLTAFDLEVVALVINNVSEGGPDQAKQGPASVRPSVRPSVGPSHSR